MSKITVIGSFVMDNVATMDNFPAPGQSVIGYTIENFPGGKGANQCVAAARLGGDVEMIGMLGADASGDTFRKILKEENIKSDRVFTSKLPTAQSQIQIDKSGQNQIVVILSANMTFGFEELDRVDDAIRDAEIVVMQFEMRMDVIEEVVRRCHKYGTKVLLNPAPAAKMDPEALSLVDYITPNETELAVLTGLPTDTDEQVAVAADALLKSGVGAVIATLGSRGAYIASPALKTSVPPFKSHAVDTVGAGDSFNGALAVALTEGKDLYDAVVFANGMGALTVQEKGAIPSMHTRAQLEEFLKNNLK